MKDIKIKDNDEELVMHSKSDKLESWLMKKQMKLLKNVLKYFLIDIKLDCKH